MAFKPEQDSDTLELDLTRPALQQPTLELELSTETQWQQTHASKVFGEIAPTKPVAVRPEFVEGHVHGSTGSPRTDALAVRPELVEGGTLPSMEEFAVAKLAEQYNYKGQLSIGALEDDIVFRVRRSAGDVLEAGKALIILKEVAGHGGFAKRLEIMSFSERTAQNYMRIADKFGKSATIADLAMQVNQANKLLEMTFFDNDELEALAAGGDVDGIDLEQIKTLSAPKLKALIKSRVETEKKPLEDEVASLTKQIENHQKHYTQLEAEKEVLDGKLKKIVEQKKLGNGLMDLETCKIREEAFAFEYGARLHIDYLRQLLNHAITTAAPNDDEQLLRVNAVAIATASVYAQVDDLFRYCQDVLGINDMPPILNSKHVLTPEEKERVEHAKEIIDHKFNVDASSRENKRFEENRKSAGRPAGSPNKLKQH